MDAVAVAVLLGVDGIWMGDKRIKKNRERH